MFAMLRTWSRVKTSLKPLKYYSRLQIKRSIATDAEKALKHDIKTMGRMLGRVIEQEDPGVYNTVEKLRYLARKSRTAQNEVMASKAFDEMVQDVKTYDSKTLKGVTRAFTHFLGLANSAENVHRVRKHRMMLEETKSMLPLVSKPESMVGTLDGLINDHGKSPEELLNAIQKQNVEIVLTAHPTEVNRRTLIRKHQRVASILKALNEKALPHEHEELSQTLMSEITSMWDSEELRRKKPTPLDEARGGLAIVESILWKAVPSYLRKLDRVTKEILGSPLPLDVAPIKISTWMGGDRDGNPNVTPTVTRSVSFLSRWQAASLFKKDIYRLRNDLSMTGASDELVALARQLTERGDDRAHNDVREPYRAVLKHLERRLEATMDWASQNMESSQVHETEYAPLKHTSELMEPLAIMYTSLVQMGHSHTANGALKDTMRRLSSFGLCMLPMDVRQESTRHTEAITAMTEYLGMGSYGDWDEAKRVEWLTHELASKRPLIPRSRPLESMGFSDTVLDTLQTFAVISELGGSSLGAYVISQCQQASDILAVYLLQRDAGVSQLMRVVPLFETLDDLHRSPRVISNLFAQSTYHDLIQGRQEVMIGYSDSAKDAGRIAASWAQYAAQEKIRKIADDADVELTYFHGKGGTVGRGGNPALFKAIIGHPPHTIDGRFRVTEQGEMITQNFGSVEIAERSLDIFTAAVLMEKFVPRPAPKQSWRDAMDRMSTISCDQYRGVVHGEEHFVKYFRQATPEQELVGLNVGSRPMKRNPRGGVESLRAIPWVFAWTQTRFNLPTWLGVGVALRVELETNPDNLREMYRDWPWFSTLVDLMEMILVKSDERIAENYDRQLVEDADARELGHDLRKRMTLARKTLLAVTGNGSVTENQALVLKSMSVRNPYVDPLNVLQAELLQRLRSAGTEMSEEERQELQDALLITINGIANGMRNSG